MPDVIFIYPNHLNILKVEYFLCFDTIYSQRGVLHPQACLGIHVLPAIVHVVRAEHVVVLVIPIFQFLYNILETISVPYCSISIHRNVTNQPDSVPNHRVAERQQSN